MILLLLLGASIGVFLLLCIMQLDLKLDAGLLLGFSLFFGFIGYTYKQVLPGSPLHLLWLLPLLPVVAAMLTRPARAWGIIRDPGVWLWFVFLLYGIVSVMWAAHDTVGLTKTAILIIRGIIPGIYIYLVYRRYGVFSWNSVLLMGMLYAAFHLAFGVHTLEYPGRLTMPGSNPIYDSRMSLLVVTIALWAKGIPLPLRLAAIGLSLVSALATQSRGPIIALLLANLLVVGIVMLRRRRNGMPMMGRGWRRAMIGLSLIAAALSVLYYGPLIQLVEGSRFNVLADSSQLKSDANYVGRLSLQAGAIEKFTEHPVLGSGLGGITPPATQTFPHNIVLEIAAELGLIGITLWSLAFAASCYAARQHPMLLVMLVQTLGYALISGNLGSNYEYVLVAFTALAINVKNKKEGATSGEYYRLPAHIV